MSSSKLPKNWHRVMVKVMKISKKSKKRLVGIANQAEVTAEVPGNICQGLFAIRIAKKIKGGMQL